MTLWAETFSVVHQNWEGSQQDTKWKNTRCEGCLLPGAWRTHGCKQTALVSLQPSGGEETQSQGRLYESFSFCFGLCTGWFWDSFRTAWRYQEDYCALLSAGGTWRKCRRLTFFLRRLGFQQLRRWESRHNQRYHSKRCITTGSEQSLSLTASAPRSEPAGLFQSRSPAALVR